MPTETEPPELIEYGTSRWHRLLDWALRIPVLPVSLEPGDELKLRPPTFREAWTGVF